METPPQVDTTLYLLDRSGCILTQPCVIFCMNDESLMSQIYQEFLICGKSRDRVIKEGVATTAETVERLSPALTKPKGTTLAKGRCYCRLRATFGSMCSTERFFSFLTKTHFVRETFSQFFTHTFALSRSLISYYVGKTLKLNILPVDPGMFNYPSFSL